MLVEIHMLQNHSPSNLNRDDTGSPKVCVFGGVRRARISSQCLKRSIRRSDIFQKAMDGRLASRTRRLPELVRARLIEHGITEELAGIGAKKVSGFGTSDGKENIDPNKEQTEFETRQTMFLTEADIAAVTEVMCKAIAEAGTAAKFEKVTAKDLQSAAALKGYRPISVDIALFGRMITSEAFRDCEASSQVAHAISTNKVDQEYDFFTAVDDLQGSTEQEDDAGADMMGDVEFNSACYYKYFSIDFRSLVANLTGENARRAGITEKDRKEATQLAIDAVEAMLTSAAMTTPSGKQNSFAAHQLPSAILVELRPVNTPVSYANAFVEPAWHGRDGDLVWVSLKKLKAHVEAITAAFNIQATERMVLAPEYTCFEIKGVERVSDLKTMCARLKAAIQNG